MMMSMPRPAVSSSAGGKNTSSAAAPLTRGLLLLLAAFVPAFCIAALQATQSKLYKLQYSFRVVNLDAAVEDAPATLTTGDTLPPSPFMLGLDLTENTTPSLKEMSQTQLAPFEATQIAGRIKQNPCVDLPASLFVQGKEIPRIFHQIWVGDLKKAPMGVMGECHVQVEKEGFVYLLWDNDLVGKLLACDTHTKTLNMSAEVLLEAVKGRRKKDRLEILRYSDVLRLAILRRFGGIYVDPDTQCLRDLSPLLRIGEEQECFVAYENNHPARGQLSALLANGVQGCRAHSETMNTLLTELVVNRNPWSLSLAGGKPWQITGPGFITDMVMHNSTAEGGLYRPFVPRVAEGVVDYKLLPHHLFHPVWHKEMKKIGRENALNKADVLGSYLMSLWGSTTRLYR
eukprot:comp21103_c0_seq1/m.28497 comp21103_c0_seq1/g.28497  ORF comp21103_c0_seq1/g.28497 comp21103_c0_seq1/m.28497 type:complete len:400 (-) comp21103_c0_seq1:547-1746(-)